MNRRGFLKLTGAGALSLYLASMGKFNLFTQAQIPGGTLAPGDVSKYVLPLVKPPAMPGDFKKNKDKYKIAVRQFQQRLRGHFIVVVPYLLAFSLSHAVCRLPLRAGGVPIPPVWRTVRNGWRQAG